MKASSPLVAEFNYYLENQDEFVRRYNGKFIAIKGNEVIAVGDDEYSAVEEARDKHELGTFLVQHVTPGDEGYTEVFHSRVSFG